MFSRPSRCRSSPSSTSPPATSCRWSVSFTRADAGSGFLKKSSDLPLDRFGLDEADELAAQTSVAIHQVAGRQGVRIAEQLSDIGIHHTGGVFDRDPARESH